jgi:choline kinase
MPLVVILAAGEGTRLRPLTNHIPKCLVEIAGRSILSRCLAACQALGLRDIVLVVGYRQEQIREEVARIQGLDVKFAENPDYLTGGTAASLSLGIEHDARGGRDLLVVEADVVFTVNLLRRLLDHPARSTTLVDSFEGHSGSLVTLGDGFVTSWLHERARPPDFVVAQPWKTVNLTRLEGCMVDEGLPRVIRETLAEDGPGAPLEYVMQRWIEQGARIAGLTTGGLRWFEVDTPADLEVATRMFADEPSEVS